MSIQDFNYQNVENNNRAVSIFFNALIILSFVVVVISTIYALQWKDRTFPGFLVYNPVIVSDVALPHWAQHQGYGIQSYDKILSVDGYKVPTSLDLYDYVSSKPAGTYFTYEILRNGNITNVKVPSLVYTSRDLVNIFGVEMFVGLVFLIIGTIVYRLKPQLLNSKVFYGICFCLGMWFVVDFEYQTGFNFYYDINWQFLAQIFTPAFLILFASVFPSPNKLYLNKKYIFLIPFVISALFFGMQFYFLKNSIDNYWSEIYITSYVYVFIGTLFVLFSLVFRYFKPQTILDKQRSRVVLIGAVFGFLIPAFLSIFMVLFQLSNLHFLVIPILIFPISIAYAIVKHKLFDIQELVQKAIVYGLSSGAVAALFILPLFLINLYYSTENLWKNPVYLLILSVTVILIVNPLKNLVQKFVDNIFFRKKYDYPSSISQFSDTLSSLLSMSEISNELMGMIGQTLFVDKGYLFVNNKETGAFNLTSLIPDEPVQKKTLGMNKIEPEHTLVEFLYKNMKEIFVEDVITEEQYAQKRIDLLKTFADYNVALIVPLFFKSDLLGILLLSNKKSGQVFTTEDINFIRTICNQTAISLENSFSFELVQDYANEVEEKNKQLKNVQAQLIQAEKMSAIGHLASGIAHEIRNPLNIIEGARYYLSSLFTNGSDNGGVAQEYLEYIQNEVIRTNRLIDSLLDFSKFQESNIENININNVIENVLILSRKQLSDSNIKIKKNLDDKLPTLKGDSNQLWQVVINLLMNSVQAINSVQDMNGEGEIVVESGIYSKSDSNYLDHLYLKVMDNGCGIREKDLSSIFDPFYTNKPDGTGLGLSVSYKIVEAHSGSMLVTSEVGIGTSFMVELPVVNQFSGEVVNGQKENLNS